VIVRSFVYFGPDTPAEIVVLLCERYRNDSSDEVSRFVKSAEVGVAAGSGVALQIGKGVDLVGLAKCIVAWEAGVYLAARSASEGGIGHLVKRNVGSHATPQAVVWTELL
jgi:hypothetical protein